jgi:two-component system, chemotaxis family, protein-glutamate methylesterase/glutaminase
MDYDRNACRELVVIGASAGGVATLRQVVSDLPVHLDAAVCIVLHIQPDRVSALPAILQRATALHCSAAVNGERLRPGHILVAPPDRHLVVEPGRAYLTLGPRQGGHRPSVDELFRSAARTHSGHVIGVVLTGTRDDGASGLAAIKAAGGGTIVQDPQEALYAGMPASALAQVVVDAVVPSGQIGGTIAAMVAASAPEDQGTRDPEQVT